MNQIDFIKEAETKEAALAAKEKIQTMLSASPLISLKRAIVSNYPGATVNSNSIINIPHENSLREFHRLNIQHIAEKSGFSFLSSSMFGTHMKHMESGKTVKFHISGNHGLFHVTLDSNE